MNRDDDNPPRSQPDASGAGAGGGARGDGGDGDDDRGGHRYRRRHHHYPHYYYDDTQVYGTSGQGGGGGAQRSRLQDECDRGYDDGLSAGEKDARKGLSSDPQRSSLYRTGGETTNRVGRPPDAKQAYRDCFLRGYQEAYSSTRLNPGGASPNN